MAQKRQPQLRMSLEEYLVWEAESPLKHEYVAGEVYAMSGPTVRHGLIALNIAATLRNAARARRCIIVVSEIKLRAAADRIYYPDMIVACGKAADVQYIIEEPSLVVEVTSPSTRATDRREKLDAYLKIASLRTYLVVEQRRRHVVSYTRDEDGEWVREEHQGSGEIPIPMLETRLTLDEIYDDVPLPPLSVKEGEEWEEEWAEADEEEIAQP